MTYFKTLSRMVDLLVIMAAKFCILIIWGLSWQFDDLSETNLLSSDVSVFCDTEKFGFPLPALLNSLEAEQQG